MGDIFILTHLFTDCYCIYVKKMNNANYAFYHLVRKHKSYRKTVYRKMGGFRIKKAGELISPALF